MRLASPTSRSKYRLRLLPIDFFWAAISPFLSLALRDPRLLDLGDFPASIPETYQYSFICIACAVGCFLFFRLSDSMSRFFTVRDALLICSAVACTVAASSVIAFTVTRLEGVPRSTPLIYGLVLSCGLIFTRVGARLFYPEGPKYTPPNPASDVRRVILVGVDRFSAAAIRLIDYQRPRTTLVVAAVDGRESTIGRMICGVKIVGQAEDLDEVIDEYSVHGVVIDEVWLSDDASFPEATLDRVGEICETRNLPFLRISEAFNLVPHTPALAPAAETHRAIVLSDYFEIKRILDVMAASILLIALMPVTLAVAALTFAEFGAPVLFWQQRVGRRGRKFLLYKFRTYHALFDKAGNRIPEDERLSKIGRAIRATRVDEIPQLYNILVGDMSLVGPRPLLPCDQPSDPSIRLLVRPGITGWAQINGGTIIGPEEKDALDIWYIRHASFALDIEILIRTLLFAVTGEKMNNATVEDALRWREKSFPDAPRLEQSPPAQPAQRGGVHRPSERHVTRLPRSRVQNQSFGDM